MLIHKRIKEVGVPGQIKQVIRAFYILIKVKAT